MYTNHCLRPTTITVFDESRIASRDIMAVTGLGQKSESSFKHYVRTSNPRKQDMSMIITPSACRAWWSFIFAPFLFFSKVPPRLMGDTAGFPLPFSALLHIIM